MRSVERMLAIDFWGSKRAPAAAVADRTRKFRREMPRGFWGKARRDGFSV